MWQRMEKFYFIQQIYRMMRELPLPSLRKMEDTKPWKRLRKDLQIESKPRSRDYFCGYQRGSRSQAERNGGLKEMWEREDIDHEEE